jgi:transposase InsO family protein
MDMNINNHIVEKHAVFQLVEGQVCTLADAAKQLNLSYRQTRRWWKRYLRASGSLVHFAVPKRGGGWNKLSDTTIQTVLVFSQRYPNVSVSHLRDLLAKEDSVLLARSTIARILATNGHHHPRVKTVQIRVRFEASACGERLQMDTTSGAWLKGYRLIYLIAVIDDYSRMIVGWKWVDSDSTLNNMLVLKQVFSRYGLPQMLYTDNASMFKTIRHGKSVYQNHIMDGYETQIQRAMRELDVVMFAHRPYQPQGKGKIERLFRFIQERFVAHHSASTLNEMNEQFADWVAWYNTKHINRTTNQIPQNRLTPSIWNKPVRVQTLRQALSLHYSRKVDKCNSFSLLGHTYIIPKKHCLVAYTIQLCVTHHCIEVYHRDTFIVVLDRIDRTN